MMTANQISRFTNITSFIFYAFYFLWKFGKDHFKIAHHQVSGSSQISSDVGNQASGQD
jgi:hypothetical protein